MDGSMSPPWVYDLAMVAVLLSAIPIAVVGVAVTCVLSHILVALWRTRHVVIAHRCQARLESGRDCRLELQSLDPGDARDLIVVPTKGLARCRRGHAWRIEERWYGDQAHRHPAADVADPTWTPRITHQLRRLGA
jgi:hypothetical protein